MKLLYKINKTVARRASGARSYISIIVLCAFWGTWGHVVKEPTQPLPHLFNYQSITTPHD